MTNAAETKAGLRLAMRARRRALALEHPDAALRAAAFYEADPISGVRRAAVYLPQGGEFDPLPLAAVLRAGGATLCLPTVTEPDCALTFRAWSPGDPMAPDAVGVPAPLEAAGVCTPDLIVAPLLAFDGGGRRLGQGGGYYDRTLQALRASARVFALGLAYAGQAVDDLAAAEHDQRLDGVLTEDGLTLFTVEAA